MSTPGTINAFALLPAWVKIPRGGRGLQPGGADFQCLPADHESQGAPSDPDESSSSSSSPSSSSPSHSSTESATSPSNSEAPSTGASCPDAPSTLPSASHGTGAEASQESHPRPSARSRSVAPATSPVSRTTDPDDPLEAHLVASSRASTGREGPARSAARRSGVLKEEDLDPPLPAPARPTPPAPEGAAGAAATPHPPPPPASASAAQRAGPPRARNCLRAADTPCDGIPHPRAGAGGYHCAACRAAPFPPPGEPSTDPPPPSPARHTLRRLANTGTILGPRRREERTSSSSNTSGRRSRKRRSRETDAAPRTMSPVNPPPPPPAAPAAPTGPGSALISPQAAMHGAPPPDTMPARPAPAVPPPASALAARPSPPRIPPPIADDSALAPASSPPPPSLPRRSSDLPPPAAFLTPHVSESASMRNEGGQGRWAARPGGAPPRSGPSWPSEASRLPPAEGLATSSPNTGRRCWRHRRQHRRRRRQQRG